MAGAEVACYWGIAIPELKMNLPIFKGLDNVGLYYGAGTMKEDQVMGERNYSLASHHVLWFNRGKWNALFPVRTCQSWNEIYITDKEKVYTYVINSVETVTPDRVDVIADREGVNEITLVTCEDAAATYRTIVKGTLETSVDYSKAPKDILEAFTKSYNQMQL